MSDASASAGDAVAAGKTEKPRFRLPKANERAGWSLGGHYMGDMCHNGVLTQVYADFDNDGELVGMNFVDVGSC